MSYAKAGCRFYLIGSGPNLSDPAWVCNLQIIDGDRKVTLTGWRYRMIAKLLNWISPKF